LVGVPSGDRKILAAQLRLPAVRLSAPLVDHRSRELALGLDWSFSFSVALFNAVTFAAIGSMLVPRLVDQRWELCRRSALTGLLLIFWLDYLNCPLSDSPALAMALTALITIACVGRPGWMFVAAMVGSARCGE
jgi:hypothetical protein